MIEIVEQYKEEGYYIFRNLYSKEYCNELKEYLNTLEVKRYIPFSNIPWGWGNLLDKGPFTKITENKIFNKFCKKLFKSDNYIFPNMMINNKASWIGPEVEWHREIFNIDTYAPGYTTDDWKSFMRVYIAIDKQTKDNGCLQIYPKSHIINDLPYENIVDGNFGHKRRVSSEAMKKVNTLCEHIYCEMEVGDMLVFTDKTVHGSNANKSPDDRKSVVLGVRHNVKKYNEEVYKKSTNYRRNFIVTELQSVIDKIKSSNMYSDFNKEKNEV
jgi:ectoine hydroxylase-related dioxygenase (phytanoyl-CoA dioxygenase family)